VLSHLQGPYGGLLNLIASLQSRHHISRVLASDLERMVYDRNPVLLAAYANYCDGM